MADPADLARDASLVAAARSGDQSAYAELLRLHRGAVFRLCRNHLGEEAEALDLTQESFAAAFAHLAGFDPARLFRTWILRIAVNKCRDWSRRRKVRRLFTFARPLEEAIQVADPHVLVDDALAARQQMDRLRRAIASLPDTLKDPLILCAIEEMSQAAAGEVLGITAKAVESRIYRARQRLAEILAG